MFHSVNAVQTLAEYYQVSFVTWSSPPVSEHEINYIKKQQHQRFKRSERKSFEELLKLKTNYLNEGDCFEVISFNKKAEARTTPLYLLPDLSSILIKFLKESDWSSVYYIYNHENGQYLLFDELS